MPTCADENRALRSEELMKIRIVVKIINGTPSPPPGFDVMSNSAEEMFSGRRGNKLNKITSP